MDDIVQDGEGSARQTTEEQSHMIAEEIQREEPTKRSKKQKRQKDYLYQLRSFLKKELKRRECIKRDEGEWEMVLSQLVPFHKAMLEIMTHFPKTHAENLSTDDLDEITHKYIHADQDRRNIDFISILMYYTQVMSHLYDISDLTYYKNDELEMKEKIELHYALDYQKLRQQYKQLMKQN